MKRSIAISILLGLWACLSVNAQTRHLMCLDVPIDGSFDEMEQKFYDSKVDFTTVAEDRTLYGMYYYRNAYVKMIGDDDRIWGVQLEIDTVFNTREEARLLKDDYERRIKQRYWSVFTEGILSYYDDVVEKWGISDSDYCTIKTSSGEVLGQIFVFIMRYYGDESKYQVYITYVDEKNRAASTGSNIVQRTTQSVDNHVDGDVLSIREAMDIAAFNRHYPLADGKTEEKYIASTLEKHHYKEEPFLEGVGTCSFWQYTKHGRAKFDNQPDDAFIPTNPALASNVAVVDCSGIETIEDDETSISVGIRVYGDQQAEELLNEMKGIGFVHNKTDEYGQEYAWKSYRIRVGNGKSRGYNYKWFDVRLELIDYGSTKKYCFADSGGHHIYKMEVDFLVKGSPALKDSVKSFMRKAFNAVHYPDVMQSKGDIEDWTSSQKVLDFYGMKSVKRLEETNDGTPIYDESLNIHKIAETDQFITFEVEWFGYYGGVGNYLKYGATFRKSDGKRLQIIASPNSQQYRLFLKDSILAYLDKEALFNEFQHSIPPPEYAPYLIQTGVRFGYQKYEIGPGVSGYLHADVSFLEIKDLLSAEVKELLKNNNIE